MNLLPSLALLLGCAALLACSVSGGPVTHQLNGAGTFAVPKYLEAGTPVQGIGTAMLTFTHYSNSFVYMGPNAVVMEQLAILSQAEADKRNNRAARDVLDHISPDEIQWRRDGAFEVGEAVQEVNARKFPVWILIRQGPEHNLTAAYMVWKKEASLKKAQSFVDGVLASFRPDATVRPPSRRLIKAARDLAARRIALTLDVGPVVIDDVFYELHTTEPWGRVLSIYAPLGPLAAADDYRWVKPAPSSGAWLKVMWMTAGGAQGMEGAGPLTDRMAAFLRAGEGYAFDTTFLDDPAMPEFNLDATLRIAKEMAEANRVGKLLHRAGR